MSETNTEQGLERIAPSEGMSASSSSDPGAITQTIKRALATGHYLGAATTCSTLPPGCEVAFMAVKIDAKRETYDIPGRSGLGITKTGLNRISKGVGVSWDARLSHRVDKGEDSFLAVYKAVGHYRDFDGSWITIEAEKQMDLRDGSEAARSMKPGELAIQRKFIAEHAQTKAQLRAIRSGLGIEIAYTEAFFDEPFVCARLVFTARSENPATQAVFDQHVAQSMLGGVESLYGSRPQINAMRSPDVPEIHEDEKPAEDTPAETEPVYCTADVCYFEESDGHVKACKGKTKGATTETETKAEEKKAEPEPWKITVGTAKGLPINSPKVTDGTLSSLTDYFVMSLESESELTEPQIEKLKAELKIVQTEVSRRRSGKQQSEY